MSSIDCTDICNRVIAIMCSHCPHFKICQNIEGEANHNQMEACLLNGVLRNPEDNKLVNWVAVENVTPLAQKVVEYLQLSSPDDESDDPGEITDAESVDEEVFDNDDLKDDVL